MSYDWVWKNGFAASRWRKGADVNLFEKGNKTDLGNDRGMALSSTMGQIFASFAMMEKFGYWKRKVGWARVKQGLERKVCKPCVRNGGITLLIVQGRKQPGLPTYCSLFDTQNAHAQYGETGC